MPGDLAEKIIEQGRIDWAALRMVLDSQNKPGSAEAHLFNDSIGSAPSLDLQPIPESVQSLVVGAIDLLENVLNGRGVPQELDILVPLLRGAVAGNIQKEAATQSEVKHLESATDTEDGDAALEGVANGCVFPSVPVRMGLLDQRGIGEPVRMVCR